nr:SDR family oxidoreductase [Terriglobus sp. TAA 43]
MGISVRPVIELSKNAAQRMIPQKWGRIINIGSVFGEGAPLPGVTMYIATKFAVHGFTRGLSRELGVVEITVNGVQPGPIVTEMSPENAPHSEVMKKLTSLGCYGRVEEVASAVASLALPESAYINGETLTVDGGWNA